MSTGGQMGEQMDGWATGGVAICTLLFQKRAWAFINIKFF